MKVLEFESLCKVKPVVPPEQIRKKREEDPKQPEYQETKKEEPDAGQYNPDGKIGEKPEKGKNFNETV